MLNLVNPKPSLWAKFLCLLLPWSIRYYISWKFDNLYLVYYFLFFNVDSIDMVIDFTTSNIQPLHKTFDEHESYSKLEMGRFWRTLPSALCFDIICCSNFLSLSLNLDNLTKFNITLKLNQNLIFINNKIKI